MWSIFFISTLLATHLPSLYGDVSHIVNNKHPGYGHHKPDQPLEYPGKGTNTHETHAGYPKVVPDNQLQLTGSSFSNSQTQYPDGGDSITAGANSGGVVTNLQTHTTGGHQHNHGADGKYDPHDDGTGWDIRKSVPGEPEQDYPTYATVPRTTFTCAEKVPGYYADVEARCQVFRICTTRSTNSFTSFLCPNGTIFNQAQLTCDWWNNVDCEHSNQYYYKNNEIGQMPEGAQLMYMIHKMLEAPSRQSYNGGKIVDSQEQGTGAVQQGIYLPPQTPVVYTTQQPLTTKQTYTFDHNVFQNVATKPVNNHYNQQQQQQSFNNNQYAQTTTLTPIHSVVQTDTSSGGYQFQQQNVGSHSTVQTDTSSGGYQYQQPNGYIPPAEPTNQQPQLTLQEIQIAEQREIQRKQQLYEQNLSIQKAQELAIKKADEEAKKQADLYQQGLQNVQRPVPQENSNEQLQHDLKQNIQQSLLQEQQQAQHNLQENVISNYSPGRPEYNQIDYANVQPQKVQPAVTFTKENTQTVTHSEKTTHTIHGAQNSDLGKGPEKISLVGKQTSVPVPKPILPQIHETQQHIPSYQSAHETQQHIPSHQSAHTSFQTDGNHQVPEISKEQSIHAINQLASAQQSVVSKVDNSKLGHGVIDIRGKDQNPIIQSHQQSVDFPSFSSESFQSFQGYPFPSETPSFHFDNFHHINSHLKSDNQRVNYEFSNDRTANMYQGQGVTNFGHFGDFGPGKSHHTYTGQNLGYKQTTRVEILPAIGFEISDPVGRNNFQTALQNGLFKDTGYQTSQSQFHPSDARYSSYLGPSSYLVPQMSVQQLPSDSGINY